MITAVVILAVLGAGIGLLLAFASIVFHTEVDPLISQVEALLPGVNCGSCGEPGCSGYAAAIVQKDAPLNLCTPGGAKTAKAIAQLLNRDVDISEHKMTASVFCKGGKSAQDKFIYSGLQTCQAAVLVNGGFKSCAYGCLGFGDCVASCKFEAIYLNNNNVPVVDPNKCINCGACIKACPKKIIKSTIHKEIKTVICSSHDTAKTAKTACSVACIGCGICVKNCPFEAIKLENNLAVIDPIKCTNCGVCVTKCPTKAIA